MKVTRKLMLATGALVLPVGFVFALSGVASASRTNTPGTGLVKCTKITGTITFTPPLTNTGTAAETTSVVATAKTCSGGSPTPTQVNSTSTIADSTNACSGLGTGSPPTISGTYVPAGIDPSTTSGGTETFQTAPKIGFTITNATTAGSYPSSTTDIVVVTSETVKKLGKACGSSKGLKSLKIKSGSVTNL